MADCMVRSGELSEALEQLRRLQITESDEMWSRMRAAIVEAGILEALGSPADALQLIDRSIAHLPEGELFWRGRLQLEAARALAALGNAPDARARATETRWLLAKASNRWRAVEANRRLQEVDECLSRQA